MKPLAEKVTKVCISRSRVPVRPGPEKQMTTSSAVLPLGTLATFWMMPSGSSMVPLNGAVTMLLAAERLKVCPLGMMMRRTAEPRYPVLQALVVDQVGVRLTLPLAGVSRSGAELLPAPLLPVLAEFDPQAPSRMTPAAATPSKTRHPGLSFIQFIGCPSRKSISALPPGTE